MEQAEVLALDKEGQRRFIHCQMVRLAIQLFHIAYQHPRTPRIGYEMGSEGGWNLHYTFSNKDRIYLNEV